METAIIILAILVTLLYGADENFRGSLRRA